MSTISRHHQPSFSPYTFENSYFYLQAFLNWWNFYLTKNPITANKIIQKFTKFVFMLELNLHAGKL